MEEQEPGDEWTERIRAAFPTRSGSHDAYATAMRMVGNRHAKGDLVALVNWLLVERDAMKASRDNTLGRAQDVERALEGMRGERDAEREIAQGWKRKAEDAFREVKANLAREVDLRAALAIVASGTEDVWKWQGEGDHSESLSCPVVMTADTLRGFVKAEAIAAAERRVRVADQAWRFAKSKAAEATALRLPDRNDRERAAALAETEMVDARVGLHALGVEP